MSTHRSLKCHCMLQQHHSANDRSSLSGTKSELCSMPWPCLGLACVQRQTMRNITSMAKAKLKANDNAKARPKANAKAKAHANAKEDGNVKHAGRVNTL